MSIKAANLWSKIGFLFGCACFLALLTADLDSYATTGQASLPFGIHGQVIVFTVMITMGCTFAQIAIWRMRHQAAQHRAIVREVIGDALSAWAQGAEHGPERAADGVVQLPSPETVAAVRRLANKVVNNSH